MRQRTLICISFMFALILIAPAALAPVALAQTPTPPGSAASCAPATPCGDSTGGTGLELGSIAMQTGAKAVQASAPRAAAAANSGLALAWVVMALLIAAVLYAIIAAILATLGRGFPMLPGGSRVLIPIFSLLGLGVALYLTFVETQNVAAVCGPIGDCNAVQSSPFARLFGFLPVGLLGAVGYVGIIVAWFAARSNTGLSRLGALLMFAMALFGVLFSIYLTYLELFVIHAVCIWCLSSAVLISLVLLLTVAPALEALQSEE
jgi:uncharacterized membrane protein